MTTDDDPPRYDPSRSAGGPPERRYRGLVLVAGAIIVARVAASVANGGRRGFNCEEAHLVPHRGQWLPFGEQPLGDPRFPALTVSEAECEDQWFTSAADFETRYYELTVDRAGRAIRQDDSEGLEAALEALARLPGDADGALAGQYRRIVESQLQADVEQALELRERALRRIEQARQL
ncbi:MAG: hypothetical protein K0V04_14400, partial [Deltaproteobacteria bacterium]|nr:hypothetical protein [Deltaproteobacteria bacterium]